MKGHIVISRVHGNREYIKIALEDILSGIRFCEIKMSLATFAQTAGLLRHNPNV